MSTATQLLTAEDLWNMPDHGGRVELVKGELRPMSPTGYDHGIITARLTARLVDYVDAHDLGGVTAAESGYIVIQNPDTVRAPDIGFVRKERIPKTGRPLKYWIGPPDLAVETMSHSDTVFDVDEKVREWLVAGTRLVWVLNPRQQTVSVFRPDNTARILTIDDTLDGEDVLAGFQLALAQLFR